jgi:hypothetical protein
MNMRPEEFPIFTLEQANMLVPKLVELTSEAIQEIEHARARQKTETVVNNSEVADNLEAEVAEILERWSKRMAQLGVYPKGYFTCDFRSPDLSAYLCWTYGEHEVRHTHKVWESFKDRKPIDDPRLNGISMSLN